MGYLSQAVQEGIVQLVNINEVQFLPFVGTNDVRTIGVRGLGACSVIVIASGRGAIVAHVGPNVPHSTNPTSFLQLAVEIMDQVEALYRTHFPRSTAGTATYVIFATFGGQVLSPQQLDIFRTRLKELDIPNRKDTPYEQPEQVDVTDDSAKGTMWVDGRGTAPLVYLEDQNITICVWVMDEGQDTYYLITAGGVVLQETHIVPPEEWIYVRNSEGKRVGKMKWVQSREEWEYRGAD